MWFPAGPGDEGQCGPVEGHWFLLRTEDGKNLICKPRTKNYKATMRYFKRIGAAWWCYLPTPPRAPGRFYKIANGRKFAVITAKCPFHHYHKGWELEP